MYNVLICDDDKDIVNALKIYLSGGDYNFFEAYNGDESLYYQSYDCINNGRACSKNHRTKQPIEKHCNYRLTKPKNIIADECCFDRCL